MNDAPSSPPTQDGLRVSDLGEALRFLTRIPLPPKALSDDRGRGPAQAAWAFALIGALVGLVGAAVIVGALAFGLPGLAAAVLAVAAGVLVTGGLHEDGLADTFDGFGGATPERRLEIMRDSTIGTYGVLALVLTLGARVAALAALAEFHALAAAFALVAGETFSRAVMVVVWRITPPARPDGLSVSSGKPSADAALLCSAFALAITAVTAFPALGAATGLLAAIFAMIGAYMVSRSAFGAFGGRTGDTLGAAQQVALAAFLIGANTL